MDMFYIIVVSVLIIVLILYLTIIGVMMSYKRGGINSYRPNNCPDSWTSQTFKVGGNDVQGCKIPLDINNNITMNKGKFSDLTSISNEKGYKTDDNNNNIKFIDFNDQTWRDAATTDGLSLQCEWKKWCNVNGIYWDGISNSTNC